MRSTWKTSLTAVRESFAALRSFQNSNDSEIQLSSNKNLGEFLSLQMMWPMLILFAAKRVVVCASLCNQHRNLEVVARVIAARRWIGKVAAQTRRWRKTNIQRDKKKQKKQTRRKQCQRHKRHQDWVLSLNTNHHQIRGPSKANLCSDWVKAESTHVCLNTYLQQILIYEKHGMLQKWCSQLKPILWHTHCKLNKNKTIWVYWGLCTKHGFLVTERVNFKSLPIFSFTILIKHRPKGTSHMLEKGTLSTPSSNNFLIFFTFYFFIRKHLLIKTVNIFESAVVTKPNHFPVTILLSRSFPSLSALFATHMPKKRCQTLVCWEGSLLFDRFGLHTMLPLFKLQSPEVGWVRRNAVC